MQLTQPPPTSLILVFRPIPISSLQSLPPHSTHMYTLSPTHQHIHNNSYTLTRTHLHVTSYLLLHVGMFQVNPRGDQGMGGRPVDIRDRVDVRNGKQQVCFPFTFSFSSSETYTGCTAPAPPCSLCSSSYLFSGSLRHLSFIDFAHPLSF